MKYDPSEEMWQHLTRWSHSMEVNYKTKEGKNILTTAFFPFDPKVIYPLYCGRYYNKVDDIIVNEITE